MRRRMMKRKILTGSFGLLAMVGIVIWFVTLHPGVACGGIESKEKEAQSYTKEGDASSNKGLYNEAIEAYKEAIKLKPYAYTYMQLGRAYCNIGAYGDAELAYREAININPTERLYQNLSYAYAKQGKYDEVIDTCNSGLNLKADSVYLLNNLADAYINKGLYDAAKAAIEKALAIEPNSAIAHSTYGEIYEKLGEYAKALEEFEKIKVNSKYGRIAQEKILKINELIKNTKGNTNN